jgi:hypothetical protein
MVSIQKRDQDGPRNRFRSDVPLFPGGHENPEFLSRCLFDFGLPLAATEEEATALFCVGKWWEVEVLVDTVACVATEMGEKGIFPDWNSIKCNVPCFSVLTLAIWSVWQG